LDLRTKKRRNTQKPMREPYKTLSFSDRITEESEVDPTENYTLKVVRFVLLL
jgi:hypothetical protein